MKLTKKQAIDNGIYSVTLSFCEYGRTDLTPEQEKELIENYGCKIFFKDIDFSGYYKVDNKNVVKGSESDGDMIKLTLNNQEVKLDETILLEYKVKADSISDTSVGQKLTSKEKVATAMCKLFADKIEEAIKKEIDDAVSKTDDFESSEDITL